MAGPKPQSQEVRLKTGIVAIGSYPGKDTNPMIWAVDAALIYKLPFKSEMQMPVRMVIARMNASNKDLLVYSPLPLNEELYKQLDSLGAVKLIIAPNSMHHLFVSGYHERYPSAKLLSTPKLVAKRTDLKFDYVMSRDDPNRSDCLAYLKQSAPLVDISLVQINQDGLDIVLHHKTTKVLISCDIAMEFDDEFSKAYSPMPPILKLYIKLFHKKPVSFTLPFKMMIDDPKQTLVDLDYLLTSYDFETLVVAHGKIVTQDARKQLSEGSREFVNEMVVNGETGKKNRIKVLVAVSATAAVSMAVSCATIALLVKKLVK